MKTTKRILGILLALVLGLALFAPMAMAEGPSITGISPQSPAARTNKSITLTVEAQLPTGAAGPLTYQWYQWVDGDWQEIEGATAKTLTVTAAVEEFVVDDFNACINHLLYGIIKEYRVVVFCDEGESSQDISATFFPGFIDGFRGFFQMVQAGTVDIVTNMFNITFTDNTARILMSISAALVFPIYLISGIMIWFFSSLNIMMSN